MMDVILGILGLILGLFVGFFTPFIIIKFIKWCWNA